MRLHEENELFNDLIRSAAAAYGLQNFQIEKDYYVSLLLKQLVSLFPDVVFKGGTSLSKCYDVIKRFSEDLDLSVPLGESMKLPRSEKKKLKIAIESVIEDLGFSLLNPDEIRSGREFNEYEIAYRKAFEGDGEMSPHILVETNVAYKPFPFELNEIIRTDFYKQDYNRNTKTFLAEDVSYEETIDSLKKIIDSNFLPTVIKI